MHLNFFWLDETDLFPKIGYKDQLLCFKRNSNKLGYIYVLTPRGIKKKTQMTLDFMKRKMREYDELKKEVNK